MGRSRVRVSASVREVESILAVGHDGGPGLAAGGRQFHGPGVVQGLVGTGARGQVGAASARSRVTALTARWAQGALSARWSTVRRGERARVAGMVKSRSRRRLGSQRRAA